MATSSVRQTNRKKLFAQPDAPPWTQAPIHHREADKGGFQVGSNGIASPHAEPAPAPRPGPGLAPQKPILRRPEALVPVALLLGLAVFFSLL